jgi:hypothetical protein
MSVSFDAVDNKLREADFFLERMKGSELNVRAWRFFFSAFVTAARSVTFVMQCAMNDIEGFADWYTPRQEALRSDPLARYLTSTRNEIQKRGTNPVCVWGRNEDGEVDAFFLHWYDDPDVQPPDGGVLSACSEQVRRLATLVYEAYRDFGPWIDPAVAYTPSGARSLGLTVEDIEEQLIGARGWTAGLPEEERFRLLRREEPMPEIDDLLLKYLKHDRFGRSADAWHQTDGRS